MSDNNSILCPSCHKSTHLTVRATYDKPNTVIRYDIAECNSCNFQVLVVRQRQSGNISRVYPAPLPRATDPRIPEAVKNDFDEALLCLSVGAVRGAAILARRAVQTICKDQGATKKDLKDKIDELFEKNIVTASLKDWGHEVRIVGNDAAHPNDVDVTLEDAEEIIDLLESLCEVLYVAPAKAAHRKSIREQKTDGAT
jgi:hypothetical protein